MSQRNMRGVSKFLSATEADRLHLAIRARWAWGAWLGRFAWTHFATLTFRCQPSADAASRAFRTWIRRLEQRSQGPWTWFRAMERGTAGLVHFHVLLAGTQALTAASLAAAWRWGRTDVYEYDPRKGAAFYITKTVVSDKLECDFRLPAPRPDADARWPAPPAGQQPTPPAPASPVQNRSEL